MKGRARQSWPWLPAMLGGLYLAFSFIQLHHMVDVAYLNSDYASAPVIGSLLSAAPPSREVTLGGLPWYSTLFFELVTKSLPFHRKIWEATPYILSLATVALVAWSTRIVSTTWAASLTAAMLICGSPQFWLQPLLALDDHTTTWFAMALCAAYLVFLGRMKQPVSRTVMAILILAVGAIAGVNLASDSLLLVVGMAPLVLAVLAAWWLHPGDHSRFTALVAMATVAIAIAILTSMVMHAEKIFPVSSTISFAGLGTAGQTLQVLWEALVAIGNGFPYFGSIIGWRTSLAFVSGMFTLVACVAPLLILYRRLTAARASLSRDSEYLRTLFIVFWATASALSLVAFLFTTSGQIITGGRYLFAVIFAAAALLPLLATTIARRAWISGGVSIYAFAGVVGLLQGVPTPTAPPSGPIVRQIEATALSDHLVVGYAGYWDAASLTWQMNLRPMIYPIYRCVSGPAICWFPLHRITTWYTPRPGGSFFLVDHDLPSSSPLPDPVFGRAERIYQFKTSTDRITMYVYRYDISTDFNATGSG